MNGPSRQPTERGRIILDRLEELSLSIAEVERRTPLTKNTITNAIYGPRSPQRKTIEILADVLDLPIESLTRIPEAPETEQVQDEEAPGGQTSFADWLFRRDNKLLWITVLGSLATAWFLSQGLRDKPTSSWVQGTHFAVALLLLTLLPRHWMAPELYQSAPHRLKVASKAARDFRRYWGLAWMCWVFLYFALTTSTWLGFLPLPTDATPVADETRWALLLLNLCQNSGTVLLFLCYEVVARPTIKDDLSRKQVLPTEAWFAIVALATVAEGILLWVRPWDDQQWFGWLSGFGQGTALALLVGRFDSKYVDPPAVTIGLLYLYAVIQGAWPVFRYEDDLMLVLTFLALVLKCLLFLFVSWLFDSNVILFYLGRMRDLDQSVRRDRAQFLTRYEQGDVERLYSRSRNP